MATKKSDTEFSSETMALYDNVIKTIPGVERKGKSIPYTSHNGHMFSFLMNDGQLALRLSKDAIPDFLKKYKTIQPTQHGALMKEYVVIPNSLLSKPSELTLYFKASYEYINTLKPKPSTTKSSK